MRERLTINGGSDEMPVPKHEQVRTYERRKIVSHLEGPNGEHAEVPVAVSDQDGALRGANFWDLDKTLLLSEPVHSRAIDQIFPEFAKNEASREELHKVYFDGFALGNSFREFDRMWRIYVEGQTQYKDVRLYEGEFMGKGNPKQRLIDEPGHSERYHERANEILQRYGKIAYGIMKEEYDIDPVSFQKRFLKPEMMQLLKAKTRLGQVHVYMTANQRDFARGIVAFSGLYKYGLVLATDETMAGGGKEIAIKKLTDELASMGLVVNKLRATAVGDSIKGDVGSGTASGLGSGVLVTETSSDIEKIMRRARRETGTVDEMKDAAQLKTVLGGSVVEAIPTNEVTKSGRGVYRFGKRSSKGSA